ncbi:hypothetical protein PtA15_18A339 [Puccinia triticina]|uniref:Uncharacterized protein n=1 Tax=Puccinia triticina TaxID=208348 RepID=A0ABY7DA98_9BASI|nr:uncharacterized protein PtA15_18A339 [Puccinia triticina]WAQ93281.1 hypothetical protein PtA15_18A339 [Puccinia triticina]WAR63270.1 hypothetical protein PtB15_18B352 [Puccinia triticina]
MTLHDNTAKPRAPIHHGNCSPTPKPQPTRNHASPDTHPISPPLALTNTIKSNWWVTKPLRSTIPSLAWYPQLVLLAASLAMTTC